MQAVRILLFTILVIGVQFLTGCSSRNQELPSQEKIQQQLKRDADMREAEDRLEKGSRAGKTPTGR
jgi:hypothetical protein